MFTNRRIYASLCPYVLRPSKPSWVRIISLYPWTSKTSGRGSCTSIAEHYQIPLLQKHSSLCPYEGLRPSKPPWVRVIFLYWWTSTTCGCAYWTSNVRDVAWHSEISRECDVLPLFTRSKPLWTSVNHSENKTIDMNKKCFKCDFTYSVKFVQ